MKATFVSRCKCKYRVRWFYSKGAFLVLVWIMLLTITCFSVGHVLNITYTTILQNDGLNIPKWVNAITAIFGMFRAVFSGWLADAKLGNYRVMKYSFVLLFFTSLCCSACTIVSGNMLYIYVKSFLFCIGVGTFVVSALACLVTLLQLGLDQMPDASSSSITSFISWFIFSITKVNKKKLD